MKNQMRRKCSKCNGQGWYHVPAPGISNQSYRRFVTHLRDDGRHHSCKVEGCLGHLQQEELRYLMGWSGTRVSEGRRRLEADGVVVLTEQRGTGGRPRKIWHLLDENHYLEDDSVEDYQPQDQGEPEYIPSLADYLTPEQNARLALGAPPTGCD